MNLKGFLLKITYVLSAVWIIFCFYIQDIGILKYAPIDQGDLTLFLVWLLGPLMLWWTMFWVFFGFKE